MRLIFSIKKSTEPKNAMTMLGLNIQEALYAHF